MQNWSTGRLCTPSVGPQESAALWQRDERECKMLLIGLDAHRGNVRNGTPMGGCTGATQPVLERFVLPCFDTVGFTQHTQVLCSS